ncbi:MAG: PHP domain-containing protein [Geobacteraceae bacterium]|nr:PHP domain-containing protein [Geobacteraceae bacterium]
MERYMDLHIHSFHSDGVLSPTEIVRKASDKGLMAIAVADHDSVSGVEEALAAGQRFGVEVVPAVELSIGFKTFHDVHLLGYYIEFRDRGFSAKLGEFRTARDMRGKAIVEKINEKLASEGKAGIPLQEVMDMSQGSLSRLHIARLLVEKGIARHVQDAFTRYLQPCDVPKRFFAMGDALDEIRRLGGVSVLAHPSSISEDRMVLGALIRELSTMGLDGLEVYNNLCYKDDMIFFESLCRETGLAMTGGSDYHGYEDDVDIGIGRGGLAVAYRLLEPLKKISRSRREVR